MSAILKFDCQKREQLRFSEVNYLNYTKDPILHVATTFSLKQGETRTSHVPIPYPLRGVVGEFTLAPLKIQSLGSALCVPGLVTLEGNLSGGHS